MWPKSQLFEEADPNNPGGGGTPPPAVTPPGDPNPGDGSLANLKLSDLKTLLGDLLKTELNTYDAKVDKRFKALTPPPADPTKKDPPAPAKKVEADPFASDREKELTTRLEAIEKERSAEKAAAQKLQLDAAVSMAVSEFTWSEGAKDIVVPHYVSQATRNEAGELVIGEMPLAAYIKNHVPRSAFKSLLASRQVGGSGAGQGSGGSGGGSGVPQLEDIKPGMTKAQAQAAAHEIARVKATLTY